MKELILVLLTIILIGLLNCQIETFEEESLIKTQLEKEKEEKKEKEKEEKKEKEKEKEKDESSMSDLLAAAKVAKPGTAIRKAYDKMKEKTFMQKYHEAFVSII